MIDELPRPTGQIAIELGLLAIATMLQRGMSGEYIAKLSIYW